MTDKEYIEGFLKNDEKVISSFYRSYRFMFTSHFMSKYRKDEDYVSDLFQDSCITIWSNITNKKLTPDNLTSSLSTYLISVGRFTMMAKDRKYKEIIDDNEIQKLQFVEDDENELRNKIEREEYVSKVVREMKSPCSELLTAFYWDKLSGVEIAEKLNYSGADSVSTQKYKCIQKLKNLISKCTIF